MGPKFLLSIELKMLFLTKKKMIFNLMLNKHYSYHNIISMSMLGKYFYQNTEFIVNKHYIKLNRLINK